MQVRKFSADHVLDLRDVQAVQLAEMTMHLSDSSLEAFVALERQVGMNYSIFSDQGELVACGGIFTIWPQRAQAWALATQDWAERVRIRELLTFTRSIVKAYPARRVEATVLRDFKPGCNWLRALGFEMEAACLKCYDPVGRDFALYAKVRDDWA